MDLELIQMYCLSLVSELSLIKRQWGQNLIKFTGVKLPGGLELNGRQIYDDAVMELEKLDEKLMQEYAMPPLDFVG